MKKINMEELERAINREYKSLNKWLSISPSHGGRIMLDVDDCNVWSTEYLDSGSYTVYASDSIKCVVPSPRHLLTASEDRQAHLEEAVKLLTDAGWILE